MSTSRLPKLELGDFLKLGTVLLAIGGAWSSIRITQAQQGKEIETITHEYVRKDVLDQQMESNRLMLAAIQKQLERLDNKMDQVFEAQMLAAKRK